MQLVGYGYLQKKHGVQMITRKNLIHEYTHNVLFLEEMVHTLFSVSAEVMARPENRVVSSIRRQPRYFDQSFHAAAVALVLAEFALHESSLARAKLFISGLLPSLDAMKNKKNLMSKHGFNLLEEMISTGLAIYEKTHSEHNNLVHYNYDARAT